MLVGFQGHMTKIATIPTLSSDYTLVHSQVSYRFPWATCSKSYREPDIRERRDSKTSNDISRDWDEAPHQENGGNVTPEHTCKRLSSFDDIKVIYDE